MTTVLEAIATREAAIVKEQKEIERLKKLAELYPDLERSVGRWEKVVFSSVKVNPLVTDYESRFNCGCCGDSPFEIWPYIETDVGRVFSKPAFYFVGRRIDHGSGVLPNNHWEASMRKDSLPEAFIAKVAKRLAPAEEDDDG